MYNPTAFQETGLPQLHAAIETLAFASLISATDAGLQVSHIPLLLAPEEGPYGTLYGHVARANTHATCSDAPADYIESNLRAITGLRLPIERLEGKWKLSQNRTTADREGVLAGLDASDDEPSRRMADAIRNANS